MTQQPTNAIIVSPEFAEAVPAQPEVGKEVAGLTALAVTTDTRSRLSCQLLLEGETRLRAQSDAQSVLPKMLTNTNVLAVFGNDALEDVNALNDKMLSDRPQTDIPELDEALRSLSREMRGLKGKYDPKDPKVFEKYQKVKGGILSAIGLGKTFLEEFLDDIRSTEGQLDRIEETLGNKQYQLLRNVGYYDVFYGLNEAEIKKLIYVISVMEIVRDLAAQKAQEVAVGDSNLGDRGQEERARILEVVQNLDNKIIAFKGRLWVAWAMAPQIRNMRSVSLALSARIDQTIDVTIPTLKNAIVLWSTLSDAQQAERFNSKVEETYNDALTMFAEAARVSVPVIASALATTALAPETIEVWDASIQTQADGLIEAARMAIQKRNELEDAIVRSKGVIDASTNKVNEALLESAISAGREEVAPLQIAQHVTTKEN